ncbi:glycosyl hydrolase catalytic core-domain-containing protein [Biscogniauxia sp. FL1348]|nr:glycosyl hydrolase catalytic core-domain-containing protein [Biscogniauxia sp. FL1348]
MGFVSIYKSVGCLVVGLAFVSPALAAPVETTQELSERASSGAKRILLWPWINTNEVENNICPALKTTASTLAGSGSFKLVANWETWHPDEVPKSLPFSPQLATRDHFSGDRWNQLLDVLSWQKNAIVQSLNEPDLAGISAADAANMWSQLVGLRKSHGVKLVTPACTSNPASKTWLSDFMGRVGGDNKPDYLGLHYYTTATNSADQEIQYAKSYITEQYNTYKIPVFISEISSTSRDAAAVQKFVEDMANWMDQQDFIFGYGFTGWSRAPADQFSSPAAQLLDGSGGLTSLGKWLAGV